MLEVLESKNNAIIERAYNEVYDIQCIKKSRWQFVCDAFKLSDNEPIVNNPFRELFETQKIDPKFFAKTFVAWLNGKNGRRNVLKLQGTYGTGKSLMAKCITKPFHTAYIAKSPLVKCGDFMFQDFHKKALINMEEPIIKPGVANDFMSLFAGDPLDVNVKYKMPVTIPKTPIIVTSNHSTWGQGLLNQVDEIALNQRVVVFTLNTPFQPRCEMTSKMFYSFVKENLE